MENENQNYINIKFKSFSNLDFAEHMDCARIEIETFVFLQSCEFSICTLKQRMRLII